MKYAYTFIYRRYKSVEVPEMYFVPEALEHRGHTHTHCRYASRLPENL